MQKQRTSDIDDTKSFYIIASVRLELDLVILEHYHRRRGFDSSTLVWQK